ncbi:MAG TPA: WbqC family protein [Ohtaekwangia sp.]
MSSVLIECQYLPSIAYFAAIQDSTELVLEKNENFIKQTYRNRCHIQSAQGTETLIIPLTAKHGKVLIKDIRIDYSQKWLNNHWRTIQSGYGKAPFFEYYSDDLEKTLFTRFDFLFDLNYNLLSMCLKWMKWNISVRETLAYNNEAGGSLDLRSVINPKKSERLNSFFSPVPYTQVFGNTFAANMSIIDLIFCEGPGAGQVIRGSVKK